MTEPTPTDLGITADTDPDNPVTNYPADVHPIGAALTIAYGSNERPFCTLGHLYRILGYLTGEIPGADDINDAITACRHHVAAQLPEQLRATDPPPAAGDDVADVHWLGTITKIYGPRITLRAMPGTPNNPTISDTPERSTDA